VVRKTCKRFVAKGIWLFGMEPDVLEALLNRYGWHVVEHVGYEEAAERYERPTGRTLASTSIERIVYAEKAGRIDGRAGSNCPGDADTIAFLQTLNGGEPRRKTIDTADKSALRQTMRSGKLK
jgi:hypothetical protein